MSFSAGGIASSLGLDLSGFSGGMLQATSIASIFPETVTAFMANPLLGVLSLAKSVATGIGDAFADIAASAKQVGAEFDNMGEAAQKAGVSTSFLSGIGQAASDAGSSTEGLGDALKFLNNNAADAAAGGEVAKAFADIGVKATDAAGKIKPTEQLFFEVADAISAIEDPARRVQAAMNLLGRGGTDMLPLLLGGSGGIRAAVAQLTEFGGVVDDRMAQAGDSFNRLGVVLENAMKGISASLALPILEFFVNNMDQILEIVRQLQPAATDLSSALGENIAGSLKVVLDLVTVLTPYMVRLLEIMTAITNAIGGVVSGVGGVFGLGVGNFDSAQSSRPASQPTAASFGSVNVTVDSAQVARDLRSQLTPAVEAAMSRVRSGVEGSARTALVGRGL